MTNPDAESRVSISYLSPLDPNITLLGDGGAADPHPTGFFSDPYLYLKKIEIRISARTNFPKEQN